jgi:hypothetical protein
MTSRQVSFSLTWALLLLLTATAVHGQRTGIKNPPGNNPAEAKQHLDDERIVIYSQDFEGDTFPPEGWTRLSPDGGSGWRMVAVGTSPYPGWESGTVPASPAGGDRIAYATWETGGQHHNDQWLVMPPLTVGDGYELAFYLQYAFMNFNDNVDIRLSTTGAGDPAAFDIVIDELVFSDTSSTDWKLYTYRLTDFAGPGEEVHIAFREHVADNWVDGSAILLDLVRVLAPDTSTGLIDADGEAFFTLYPNPARDAVTLRSDGPMDRVRLFDATGRLVYRAEAGGSVLRLETGSFPEGLYILEVVSGQRTATRKLQIIRR